MSLADKTLATSFAKEMGLPVINMGDKIREIARKNKIKIKEIGDLTFEIRNKYGRDAIAKECYEITPDLPLYWQKTRGFTPDFVTKPGGFSGKTPGFLVV